MNALFSKAKRSLLMSLIRGRGNRDTELRLISILKAHQITGWQRNYPLFGKPDFVFRKAKLAIFVDGCFWHGCPKHSRIPDTNREYWTQKIKRNKLRDRLVTRTLITRGWNILRIWEHDLSRKRELLTVAKLVSYLNNSNRISSPQIASKRMSDGSLSLERSKDVLKKGKFCR